MRRLRFVTLLGVLTWPTTDLPAQDFTSLNQGQLVRVTAPRLFDRPVQGVVLRQSGDTLLLRDARNRGDADPRRVSLSAIERLDVRRQRSRGSGAKRGLIIGLIGGAVTGAVVGAATDVEGGDATAGESAGVVGLFGAGAVLGSVIGALVPGSRWVEAPLPARVGLVPLGTSMVGLSLRIPFA